jgi:alpha-amylase/alpha-mannosidase (GH57 family)
LVNTHVCIHGHFYQPPRENPFTGMVEDQPSASPYANWNERIDAECYGPNAHASVLGDDGNELFTIDNYEWISSDWGPTLLRWLEEHSPRTYASIISADRRSIVRFDGHGSALAHAYNHTILPLSNSRDKRTQVLWGIADFEHRFGRSPVGMWLPETAVDLESLEIMAAAGIRFTVLAPYQARRVHHDGEPRDVTGGSIDPRTPYLVQLPSGAEIAVFFYDGSLSQEIAFDGLLEDGILLANRLADAAGSADAPVLANVATDGETFGHHHRFGEMALAKAIMTLDAREDVVLTNFASFLDTRPPTDTVEINEGTSWSCAHGVERWRSNCGCSTGQNAGWDQEWRAHLRTSLDFLRDSLIPEFERLGGELLVDAWEARDRYVEVLLGASPTSFLAKHQLRPLDPDEASRAVDLLEIQHSAMLMYTSCGWFFDDISGIETVFVLRQAGRAIDLARRATGVDLEPEFLEWLEKAHSNEEGVTGRHVYEKTVSPYMPARTD